MKIKINGTYIKFFDEVAYSLKLDSVASLFSFVGRYNPENPLHRKIYRPLSFARVEIFSNDDKLIITGQIVNHEFSSNDSPGLWKLSGYSLPGVLEDVNIAYTQYPLESLKRNLKDITERLIKPFGLSLQIDPSVAKEMGIVFEKSVAGPTESIKSYISKMAAQRNIVLSHNAAGQLVFFRPNTNGVPKFRYNKKNTLEMGMSLRGQGLHSEISVLRQPGESSGNISPVDSVKNPLIPVFRPAVDVLTSGTDTETKQAANNKLAAELKNIEFSLSTNQLQDFAPGDIVEVQNDEVFLHEYTRLMITTVNISESSKGENMSLSLTLPEAFTGETPKQIFQ